MGGCIARHFDVGGESGGEGLKAGGSHAGCAVGVYEEDVGL
jgi:hypothetical protein